MPSVKELLAPTAMPARLPGEEDMWYERFCSFVSQGPGRSVLSVYNEFKRGKARNLHKKYSLAATVPMAWRDTATGYDWRRRAAEWDALERERNRQLTAERQREQIEREMADAEKLREKGLDGLSVPLVSAKLADGTVIDGSPAAVKVAADLLKQSSAFQRRALGMPETRIDVRSQVIELTAEQVEKMTDEQLEAVEAGVDVVEVLKMGRKGDAK